MRPAAAACCRSRRSRGACGRSADRQGCDAPAHPSRDDSGARVRRGRLTRIAFLTYLPCEAGPSGELSPGRRTGGSMTVDALRRGRPEVLADLLARYGRDMHSVAYLILRDQPAAEDVVADSLLAALDHGHGLRDETALRPWLLRIATNKALRARQRASRVVEIEVAGDAVSEVAGPGVDDPMALWQAVQGLPPRMRAAIALHYYLDLPVDV